MAVANGKHLYNQLIRETTKLGIVDIPKWESLTIETREMYDNAARVTIKAFITEQLHEFRGGTLGYRTSFW